MVTSVSKLILVTKCRVIRIDFVILLRMQVSHATKQAKQHDLKILQNRND